MELNRFIEEINDDRGKEDRPSITLSYAQSIDGSIAVKKGERLELSSLSSLEVSHKLRAVHDAILVGIGTVIGDDPHLNVRYTDGSDPIPLILDSNLKFPEDASMLKAERMPWIFTRGNCNQAKEEFLEGIGCRVIHIGSDKQGRVNIHDVVSYLKNQGLRTLMVEGGAGIITSFLKLKIVDRFIITIAPFIIGGFHSVENLHKNNNLLSIDVDKNIKLDILGFEESGNDIIIWGYIC